MLNLEFMFLIKKLDRGMFVPPFSGVKCAGQIPRVKQALHRNFYVFSLNFLFSHLSVFPILTFKPGVVEAPTFANKNAVYESFNFFFVK